MSIKLSICIPTYNRAAFLGEALDSVIRQSTDEVEIVVSDNASTDNTEALVREYQARFARIRYHKNPENLGSDRNFLKVVELGEGEYCWLLGSDDALADGAIAAMLPLLGDADVYLMDRTNMSFAMDQILVAHERFLGAPPGTTYDCRNLVELSNYFRDALHIGSFFSFMSALVVRRSVWQAQPIIDELMGSAWIHAVRVFQMMQAGARVHYIGRPLVLNRTGNDSLHAAVGFTRRRLVDLDYPRLARTVFVDHPELANEVTKIVAQQFFSLRVMLSHKRTAIEADGPAAAQRLAAIYQQEFSRLPGYRIKMVLWNALPMMALEGMRFLSRRTLTRRNVGEANGDSIETRKC